MGCARQKGVYKKPADLSLSLAMPSNIYLGTDLAPLVYRGLYNHFNRVGYQLRDQQPTYHVAIKLLSCNVVNRFASQGLLAYATRLKLVVQCQVTDITGKQLCDKKFSTYALVNQPADPVHKGAYHDYAFEQAVALLAPRIDYYLRHNLA